MAMVKYGHAAVSTPIVSPDKWIDKKTPAGRVKVARKVIARYDPSKWLLSHVTIVASVDTELANPKDPKSNYFIRPEHSQFVNNNGDCWERNLLKATYKSFLNADNFIEHIQIPELSKGKVIDVALREVPIGKSTDGIDLTTLYVDILIATNRIHTQLIHDIISGNYNAVSMGCLIAYSICSRCGNVAADEPQLCQHVKYYKNNYFHDPSGIRRIIAELCGKADDPDSNEFVDASWVKKPAFGGAVLRNLVEPGEDVAEKIQTAISVPSFQPQPGMMLRAASEAASTLMREINAQEESEDKGAEPPKDDTDFPPPGDEAGGGSALGIDQPGKEDTGGGGEEAPGEGLGEAPGGEEALKEKEPEIQEPQEDANVKEVEEMMTKHILNKIRRKLLKEEVKERAKPEDRPVRSETEEHGSLVREAADTRRLLKIAKQSNNKKLINGLMILSNLNDWRDFKKYGYNRNDVLGLMAFIDQNISDHPLNMETIKTLSNIRTANLSPQNFFTELIVETGNKPDVLHAKRLLKWAKILSVFE